MAPSDPADRLRDALGAGQGGTSDHDLNPGAAPRRAPTREAAVLVAVDPEARVILTKRASHLAQHPGQIAFPGGKVEPFDDGPVGAALREANEEIGLPAGAARILGTLPPHETVTGFRMTPVLARIAAFDPVPEAGEVAEVFRVPLRHLADPAHYRVEGRSWRGGRRSYYVVPWGPYYIWGATAMILRSLAERLR